MFCKKCGTDLEDDGKFCYNCGAKATEKEELDRTKRETIKEEFKLTAEEESVLSSFYKSAWDASIAVSVILGVFIPLLTYINVGTELNASGMLLIIAIWLLAASPFFYFGRKIKNANLRDLEGNRKVLNGMSIYAIVGPLLLAAFGLGMSGWVLISAYFYYKAAKVTKLVSEKGDISSYLAKANAEVNKVRLERNKKAFRFLIYFLLGMVGLFVLVLYISG